MGLDMHLTARKYVSGWKEDDDNDYRELVERFGMKDVVIERFGAAHVEFEVAYWRKANAIHGWFVKNVQDGKDECLPHYVSKAQLKDLRAICQDVLLTKEKYGEELGAERGMELLPPCQGFFFGVYDIGPWYWDDLEDTVKQIDRIFDHMPDDNDFGWDFQYRSSW